MNFLFYKSSKIFTLCIVFIKFALMGQLPQYYVENDHMAIISREVFDKAQEEISRRAALVNPTYPFTGKIKCGICGCHYTKRSATVKGGNM